MSKAKDIFMRAARNEPLTNILADEAIKKPLENAMRKGIENRRKKKGCGCIVIIVIGFLSVLCML